MDRKRTVLLFISVVGILFLLPLWAVLTQDRYALHLAINEVLPPDLDGFMRMATHLADGLVPLFLSLVLLFLGTRRSFLMMGLSTGLSAMLVQLLKRNVFGDIHRPFAHLSEMPTLRMMHGVELHHHFSFPSGHSTAAMSMCFALAVIIGKPKWAVPLAVLAAVLCFTRVYLSQHFLQDILAGGALGLVTGLGVHALLYTGTFSRRPWLQRQGWRRAQK